MVVEEKETRERILKQCSEEVRPELGGHSVGDLVRLPGIDLPFEIVALERPWQRILREPSSRAVRANSRAVSPCAHSQRGL